MMKCLSDGWRLPQNELYYPFELSPQVVQIDIGAGGTTNGACQQSVGPTHYGRFCPTSSGSICLLYTSPSPRDGLLSRMPSSA